MSNRDGNYFGKTPNSLFSTKADSIYELQIHDEKEILEDFPKRIKYFMENCEEHIKVLNNVCDWFKKAVDILLNMYNKREEIKKKKEKEGLVPKELSNTLLDNYKVINFLENYISPDKKIQRIIPLYNSSNESNDSCENFRKAVRDFPSLLIVAKSGDNKIFGGYTSKSLNLELKGDCYKKDENAFLFSVSEKKVFPINKKYSKYGILCSQKNCFDFGIGSDFLVRDSFLSSKQNHSEFSGIFDGTNGMESLNGKEKNFTIKQLEVYQIII